MAFKRCQVEILLNQPGDILLYNVGLTYVQYENVFLGWQQ